MPQLNILAVNGRIHLFENGGQVNSLFNNPAGTAIPIPSSIGFLTVHIQSNIEVHAIIYIPILTIYYIYSFIIHSVLYLLMNLSLVPLLQSLLTLE